MAFAAYEAGLTNEYGELPPTCAGCLKKMAWDEDAERWFCECFFCTKCHSDEDVCPSCLRCSKCETGCPGDSCGA